MPRGRPPKNPGRSQRRGILAAGNFVIDHVTMIDRFPAEDTIAEILSSGPSNGGPSYNALVDLAQLKAPFPLEALGLVGDDADGAHILRHCAQLGIDTRQLLKTDRASTSYSDIMTAQSTGRRTIFHHQGATALLDEKHFAFHNTQAKMLHLAFIALLARLDRPSKTHGTVAAKVLAQARAAGMITSADVVSDASGRLKGLVVPCLPHLDYLFVNETELELITGARPRTADGRLELPRLEAAARLLMEEGLAGWLVVHAAEGAAACRAGQTSLWQGSVVMPPDKIVGTNGAGDAFAAGFLYGVHQEMEIIHSLRMGVCVAAASITDGTPSAGIGTLRSCLRLGDRYGYRTADVEQYRQAI
jgi:sugar/nucleoside kinase (ribokinase family)